MKRLSIVLACCLLLTGCGAAAAPAKAPAPTPEQTPIPTVYVEEGMLTVIDLDGDGEKESIEIETVKQGEYMEYRTVRITDGHVIQSAGETMIQSRGRITLADLDGDRLPEILLSGDMASDDYVSYACRWNGSALVPISFRCDDGGETYMMDGGVELAENGAVTLSRHLFMLGTYGGFREFVMGSDGCIGPVDGSVWEFRKNDFWLETAADLSAELPAGTKLRLTAGDDVGTVWFVTEDGRKGSLALTVSDKWGWDINGVHELDCFTDLPYAG